ncbi:hypothetical protein Dimus_011573 [Dionaea muscipula]
MKYPSMIQIHHKIMMMGISMSCRLLKESWMLLLLISLLMSHLHHVNGDFLLIRSICAKTRYRGECTKCLKTEKPPPFETRQGYLFPLIQCPISYAETARSLLIQKFNMGIADSSLKAAYFTCIDNLLTAQRRLMVAIEALKHNDYKNAKRMVKVAYDFFMPGCSHLRSFKVPPDVAKSLSDEKIFLLVAQELITKLV